MATDDSSVASSTSPPPAGGSVEPVRGARPANPPAARPAITARELPGERYELRDPFAEVTYRVTSLADMAAKADTLQATRFHAIDPTGQRTPIDKVGGTWQRGRSGPAPETAIDASPKVVPLVPSKPDANPTRATPETSTARSSAAVDLDVERAERVRRLEAALSERYVITRAPPRLGPVAIGDTEYRYRGDVGRIAFTASTGRLSTDNNNPSVARSMVDVAEARQWKTLRVTGHDEFKRQVWLEASVRGVKTVGYAPQPGDHEALRTAQAARLVNRIEPGPVHDAPSARDAKTVSAPGDTAASANTKQSSRGGGRKAVLAALDAVLVAKNVPTKQREAVMTAAAENLAQRLGRGEKVALKIYDKAAPSQREMARGNPTPAPVRQPQRTQEQAAPTR